jgi:flagellin
MNLIRKIGASVHAAIGRATRDQVQWARSAIDLVDAALNTVNSSRSEIGASVRRLGFALDFQTGRPHNETTAESRIRDRDFAEGTAELTRAQIASDFAIAAALQVRSMDEAAIASLLNGLA